MKLKFKRIMAAVIDFYIISLSLIIPLYYINNIFNNDVISVIIGIIVIIAFIFLYLNKDCLLGKRSVGKKLLGLNIYLKNEIVVDKKILLNRTRESFSLFPIYPFNILFNNKSLGDIKFETEVK